MLTTIGLKMSISAVEVVMFNITILLIILLILLATLGVSVWAARHMRHQR